VAAVADFLVSWVKSGKAPASFNVDSFNSAMIASATEIGPDYVFQCVGFAVAVNPNLGSSSWGGDASSWQAMIAHGSAACPRIDPAGAGVGDFLLMPSGNWYHIQVLSKLNQDGSFAISQANWTGNGDVSNVSYGGDKNGTLANEKNLQKFLRGEIGDGLVKSVLRCQ
jgi:hypothetical protein